MPIIYGPSSTASITEAKISAEKFVDQVESAANSRGNSREDAEKKQWEEMTALTKAIIEIEGQDD